MTERPYFTVAQQRAAYLALGLDKQLFRDTYEIVMEPGLITVKRYDRRAEDGKFYLCSEDVLAGYDSDKIRATRRSYARKQRRR